MAWRTAMKPSSLHPPQAVPAVGGLQYALLARKGGRMSLELGREVLTTEAEAILRLRDRLDESFSRAVDLIVNCQGRVVWTGMGKSGIICRKLAATMASTGTPALFLHPAEATHGDLGMVTQGDVVVAVSNSGETEELVHLVAYIKRLGVPLVAVTSNPSSTLAGHAEIHLNLSVDREACPHNLAPTASTTAALALGDALAMVVSVRKGFKPEDFARLHPGGKLGKHLLTVEELMHSEDDIPCVGPHTPMKDVIYEMSRKGLGITTVQDGRARLLGVITDGDLRRLMESEADPLHHAASEVMHPGGITIPPKALATAALRLLETRRITSVVVIDDDHRVLGILHLHDLWGVGLF
jgi:arabinose-5-phosphate isomerase